MRWWAGLAGLTIVGLLGLYTGSRAATGVGEATGVILAIAAALAAFLLVKELFDDGRDRFLPDVKLRRDGSRVALCVILGVIGLAGLLGAAKIGGDFYVTGLALAIASTIGIFLTIKGHYDGLDDRDGR